MILIKNPRPAGYQNTVIDTKTINENDAERFPVNNPLILSYLIQNTNVPVVITDLQDNIVFINNSFVKTFGLHSREVCFNHLGIIFPLHSHEYLYKTILFESQNGGWKGEAIIKKKNGEETTALIRSQLLFDKDSFQHFIFYTFAENIIQ